MKIPHAIFLPLSVFVLSASAYALPSTEISCHSKNVADAGFVLKIDGSRFKGVLEEDRFAGPRFLADLQCEKINVTPTTPPNDLVNTVVCRSQPKGHGGYVIRLFEGGTPFRQEARVFTTAPTEGNEIETLAHFGELGCYLPR
jgi:hypothetical protein